MKKKKKCNERNEWMRNYLENPLDKKIHSIFVEDERKDDQEEEIKSWLKRRRNGKRMR